MSKYIKHNYVAIINDYNNGLSLKDISIKYDIDFSYARKLIIREGGKTRTIKEACLRGEKHPMWKGGKTKDISGYEIANGERYHRIMMERFRGRELKFWEVVHHVDGNKSNNIYENLVIIPWREHTRFEMFLFHRQIIHSKEMLIKIARMESPYYYRFTKDDFYKAAVLFPLKKGTSFIVKRRKIKRCCIKGCGRKYYGTGLCSMHWQRKRAKQKGYWVSSKGRTSKFRQSWKK